MRANRLVTILLTLQTRRRVTARELSEQLEVSPRTVQRDMDALSSAGIPVFAERGNRGGWSLLGDYQTKLTGMTAAEIQSLFVGQPKRLLADLGLQQPSESALMKMEASLPAAVRQHAELARRRILIDTRGWRDPAESASCLPVLLDALWHGRQVRFLYARDFADATERTCDPLGVVAKGSIWYLVANIAGETRTYRVSRMREAIALGIAAQIPADFDLAGYWARSAAQFREKLPRYYATFLANPSVMQWVRYRGWRVEEETAQGEFIRIRMRFDLEEEAVQFALSFGGDVQVAEPEALRDRVVAGARAVLSAHGQFAASV